ncbi:MAG: sensor histidine kinase [Pedobacter sp.]|nr:MAG: sensor histidine kinase [Pedobacter sp.]
MILAVCCIGTAISLKHAITKKDLLAHEASVLQDNLSAKERIARNFLASDAEFNRAKLFHANDSQALAFIDKYRDKGIYVLVYENQELKFWSGFRTFPSRLSAVREGSSFLQFANGWYQVVKKTRDNYAVVFLIAVKNQYNIENKYLRNEISASLSPSKALTLANFSDTEVAPVKDLTGKLLFEVKLLPAYVSSIYAKVEVWLWAIGLFSFCLFFNGFCSWLVQRGQLAWGTLLITIFFLAVRLSDLHFGWFNHQFNLDVFDPKVYAESFFLPSLGDFLLNVMAVSWVVLFIYTNKDKYRLPQWMVGSKVAGILFHLFCLGCFASLGFLFDDIFFGLINNSKINFDITNIVNLGWISWISIVILCLVWFNTYLFAVILITLTLQLKVTNRERLAIFLFTFGCYIGYRLSFEFTVFFIAYSLFIFIVSWNIYLQQHKFYVYIYALMFFCLAFISSIKYLKYNDIKERNYRYNVAQELQSTDDPKVVSAIESVENGIIADNYIPNYFKSTAGIQHVLLENYIGKNYLDGYLSKFEYSLYAYPFNTADTIESKGKLGNYKKLVRSGSVKISNYFYRLNDTFGYQNYFGIIPVFKNRLLSGTLVIELKSQQYNYNSQFPDVLMDGKIKSDEDYSNYSFAFYNSGKLIKQFGKFTYKLANSDFKGDTEGPVYFNDENFNHLVYMPSNSKLIVISKEKVGYVMRLATLSFFFLVFILFSVILYMLIWTVKNIDETWGGWFNINRSLIINANKILYKTRIQFSIVLSVVATLLIVGWTTYFYISEEYKEQQNEFMREKVRKVQLSYEKQIYNTGLPAVTEQSIVTFNQFADVNAAFLNLFDVKGNLLFTSLPKLYEYGVIGNRMGSRAYIYLHQLQRSEYVNPAEQIGDFTYSAAYAPIRNAQNETVAYIGLPYYGNETDYQTKINLFVNTLINIYALVFVGIGILAVFLANQITSPLTFIQESIRKTKLGQKNQPILWSRHDEIGSLIKEYNKMIAALEESALKLARSEREHAWREMAKQVAHEIKNPLTPLKLGVQLLEKSWKEEDPNFDKKFDKFNKSFVEQIDSLARIASEFSNFAKMPDAKFEKIKLLPIIEQSKNVYINSGDISIDSLVDREIEVLGDKDQLLRAFNNLFKNATEAVEEGTLSVITIRVTNDESEVRIEVADNGRGIDESLHDNIFVPNFTTKSSGTGLGLAFVKQAIENAGGSVSFKSIIDGGTTFYLTFPLV